MTPASERVRIAVVGAGGIGARHARLLARQEGVSVVAAADLDADRLEQLADTGARGYERWEDMLAVEQIDALVVSTPPMFHAAPAIVALENGVHVFMEKPIARSIDDAKALADAASRSGAVCSMGYQWRAIEFLDEVRAELSSQQVGLLAGRSLGSAKARPWFVNWQQGGGILLELASHDIDLQRAVAGEVTSVQATASEVPISGKVPHGFRSVLLISLRFESGALGSIAVAVIADELPTSWALDVISDAGAFFMSLDPEFSITARSRGRAISRAESRPPSETNMVRFLQAVRAADPSLVSSNLDDGMRTLEVALCCDRALETGETVEVRQ